MRITPFLKIKWLIKHLDTEYIEGKRFVDIQIKHPFSHWKHTHDIIPYGNSELSPRRLHRIQTTSWKNRYACGPKDRN